jgi:hypothetical protein
MRWDESMNPPRENAAVGRREVGRKFSTEDLPFAAFLHAAGKMRFLGCRSVNGNGRIAFVFDDPRREGQMLQIEFESGAECAAVAFYDSVRHLRRVMDGTRNNGTEEQKAHANPTKTGDRIPLP